MSTTKETGTGVCLVCEATFELQPGMLFQLLCPGCDRDLGMDPSASEEAGS